MELSEQSKHITRGIGSLTLQNIGTSALGFIFLAVLLRLLPSVDYGIYSALSVSVGIVAVVAPMGLQYAAAKFLADVQDRAEIGSRAKKYHHSIDYHKLGGIPIFRVLCARVLSLLHKKCRLVRGLRPGREYGSSPAP